MHPLRTVPPAGRTRPAAPRVLAAGLLIALASLCAQAQQGGAIQGGGGSTQAGPGIAQPGPAQPGAGPGAVESSNPLHGKRFQDWTIRCEAFKNAEGAVFDQCHMYQEWHHKERKMRLLHMAVAYPRQKPSQAVVVLTLPLGVYLPAGVKLQVDKGESMQLDLERCEAVGCKTGFPVEQKMLNALRRGTKANITFGDLRRQPLTVPVSLNGFTAALRALEP